ncbi:hypothetical protein AURDEDRAFT_184320 [Auricularia subglabra TFB-10046 SS5]|nr:hypothetical protein AURDEDRAFT_184320 [Auricularia subglabra TFB-10046 SS5]
MNLWAWRYTTRSTHACLPLIPTAHPCVAAALLPAALDFVQRALGLPRNARRPRPGAPVLRLARDECRSCRAAVLDAAATTAFRSLRAAAPGATPCAPPRPLLHAALFVRHDLAQLLKLAGSRSAYIAPTRQLAGCASKHVTAQIVYAGGDDDGLGFARTSRRGACGLCTTTAPVSPSLSISWSSEAGTRACSSFPALRLQPPAARHVWRTLARLEHDSYDRQRLLSPARAEMARQQVARAVHRSYGLAAADRRLCCPHSQPGSTLGESLLAAGA